MPQNDNIIRQINLGSGNYDIESINSQIVDMQGLVINKTEQTVTGETRTTIITRLEKLDIKRPIVLYNLYREPEYEEDNIDYTITSYQSIICRKSDGTYEQRLKIYNYRNREVTITACNGFIGTFTTPQTVGQNSTLELTASVTSQGNPRYVPGGTGTGECNITYTYTEGGSTVTATMTNGYWAGYDYTANGSIAYAKGSASTTKGQIEIIAPIDADKVMYVWADLGENSTQPIKYQIKDIESSTLIKINMGMFTFKHNVRSSTSGLGSKIAKQLADPAVDKGNQILIYNFRMLDEANQLNNFCLLNVAQEEYNENNELVSRELEGSVSFNQQLFSLRIKVVKDTTSSTGWQISEYDARALESSQINFGGILIPRNEIGCTDVTNIVNDFLRAKKNTVIAGDGEEIGIAPVGLYNFQVEGNDTQTRSRYANLMHKNTGPAYINSYSTFYDRDLNKYMAGLTEDAIYHIDLNYEERRGLEKYYFLYSYPTKDEARPTGKKWQWKRDVGVWADLNDVVITKEATDPYGFKLNDFTTTINDPDFTWGIRSQSQAADTYSYVRISFNVPHNTDRIRIHYYFGGNYWGEISQIDGELDHGTSRTTGATYIGGEETRFGYVTFTGGSWNKGQHHIDVKYVHKESYSVERQSFLVIGGININIPEAMSYIYTGYKTDLEVGNSVYSPEVDSTNIPKIGKVKDFHVEQDPSKCWVLFEPVTAGGSDGKYIIARKHLLYKNGLGAVRATQATTTIPYRAYVARGTDTSTDLLPIRNDSTEKDTLVQRGTNGVVIVGTPTTAAASINYQAVNVGYADSNYVPKLTTPAESERVFVQNSDGTIYGRTVTSNIEGNTSAIIVRDANNRAQIATPTASLDIANKKYVDDNLPRIIRG